MRIFFIFGQCAVHQVKADRVVAERGKLIGELFRLLFIGKIRHVAEIDAQHAEPEILTVFEGEFPCPCDNPAVFSCRRIECDPGEIQN